MTLASRIRSAIAGLFVDVPELHAAAEAVLLRADARENERVTVYQADLDRLAAAIGFKQAPTGG